MNDISPSPAATHLLARPWRALTIGIILLVAQLAFEALAVTTAMPTVARALGGLSLYAIAFGAPFATSIVGIVISGQWSDSKGPAAPLLAGTACFIVGLLVAGFASSMFGIIVGRALQGFGSGHLIVALYVVIGRAYPEELRPRMFAAFAGAWVLPSLFGPLFAGLIVEHIGWRWVFLGVAALVLPAALLVRPALRGLDSPPPAHDHEISTPAQRRTRNRQRLVCVFIAAISTALLHYAGHQRGVDALLLVVVSFGGVALSALFLLPRGTLTLRAGLPSVVALRGIAASAYIAAEVFVPLMLTTERGWPPTFAGLALTAGGVLWAVGSWYQGRPAQGMSRASLLRLGMILTALGIAVSALVLNPAAPATMAVIGWGLAGFGMGLVYPTLSVLTLQLSRPDEQGESSSALQLSDAMFSTAALAVAGSLFAALVVRSATNAYLACFAVALVISLIGVAAAARPTSPATSRHFRETP